MCVHMLFHSPAISRVYPDPSGTRVVFVDEKSDAYLHNPVSSTRTTKHLACILGVNPTHAQYVAGSFVGIERVNQ